MISGTIIFTWSSQHEERVTFGHQLKGLMYEGKRPVSYRVEVGEGTLSAPEAKMLTEWLNTVTQVCSLFIHT